MTFNFEVTIADIIAGISLLFIFIGGIFTYLQWRMSVSLKRASYINDLTEKIHSDPNISEVIYLLDYDKHWYSKDFHGDGDLELKIDKTLSYFSYICYLKKRRIIRNGEFKFFKYKIERILNNAEMKDYLYNLYHFSKNYNIPITPQYLFEYGEKFAFFEDDFYNSNSYNFNPLYHKYLNFREE